MKAKLDKKDVLVAHFKANEPDKFSFFIDDMKDVYVSYEQNGRKEIKGVKSIDFRNHLTKKYFSVTHDMAPRQTIDTLLDYLPYALSNEDNLEQKTLWTRVGMADDRFYYDFTNKDWDICEIDKNGWRVKKQDKPIFRRNNGQNSQCFPEDDNCFNEIFDLVNIRQEDQMLFAVTVISYFIPSIAHPVLMFTGVPGVSKTTTHSIVKSLIDPTVVMQQRLPKEEENLLIQWRSQYVLFYDNVSTLSPQMSDAFCRGVTGAGASARKLYTDFDEIYYNLRRCFLINGIDQPGTKPDLLQRTVLIELEQIKDDKRKTEKEIMDKLELLKPRLLGSIFNAVARAMSIQPSIKLSTLPRLADFAIWGEAISQALGFKEKDFIDDFFARQESQEKDTAKWDCFIPPWSV